MKRILSAIVAILACLPGAAVAQQALCLANQLRPVGADPTIQPPPDWASSDIWRQLATMADPQMMQRLVGVWQTEVFLQATNTTMRTWYKFDANGLFEYQQQLCQTNGLPCTQNGGPGEFRASRQASGTTFFMIRYSDLSRVNQCLGVEVNFQDDNSMMGRDGAVWRRVQ